MISTFSFSPIKAALLSGLTLKPIIIAFEAAASVTSVSVIAPTPECITLTLTLSVDIFQGTVVQPLQILEHQLLQLRQVP